MKVSFIVALGLVNSHLISEKMGNTRGRPDTRPSIEMTDVWLLVKRAKKKKKGQQRKSIAITSFYDYF